MVVFTRTRVQLPYNTADCEIVRDEDWLDPLPQVVAGGIAYDLSDQVLEIQIRPHFDDEPLIKSYSSAAGEILIDDAVGGLASMNVSRANVIADLPAGDWRWFALLASDGGYTELFRGRLTIHDGRIDADTPVGTIDADALAILETFTEAPTYARKELVNRTVRSLKTFGIWDRLDILYVLAAGSEQAALLNWKDPAGAFDAAAVNAPTFAADRGFIGNGTSSYLRTNWTPSLHAVNFQQDDASVWEWPLTDAASNSPDVGNVSVSPQARITPRNATNNFALALNDGTASNIANISTIPAMWGGSRSSAATRKAWRNGDQFGADLAVASTGLPTQEQWILGTNATLFSPRQIALAAWGASLAGLETYFWAIMLDYLREVGAVTSYYAFFGEEPIDWIGSNNRPDTPALSTVQSFGYSTIRQALGGVISRSLTNAEYRVGLGVGGLSLNDNLSYSGTVQMVGEDEGGVYFGWFNSDPDVRPAHFLGLFLKADGANLIIRTAVWTGTWRASQIGEEILVTAVNPYTSWVTATVYNAGTERIHNNVVYRAKIYHTSGALTEPGVGADWATAWTNTKRSVLVGSPTAAYAVTLNYDATAETIAFTVAGLAGSTKTLPAGFKADNATFNVFGFRSQYWYTGAWIEVYVSALTYDDVGGPVTPVLTSAPGGWNGVGNNITFGDIGRIENQNFGFTATTKAGTLPAEVGGVFNTVAPDGTKIYYAAPLRDTLTADDPAHIRGKVSFYQQNVDSGMWFGFFDETNSAGGPAGALPPSILAIYVEGPSDLGHHFSPFYVTTAKNPGRLKDTLIRPNRTKYPFELIYDPDGGTDGRVTVVFNGATQVLDVSAAHRAEGWSLTHFGARPRVQAGGGPLEIYFSELEWSGQAA